MTRRSVIQACAIIGFLFMVSACSESRTPFADIEERPDAFIRTLETKIGVFNRQNLTTNLFEIDFEVFDEQNGQLLESVDVHVSLMTGDIEEPSIVRRLTTINKLAFTPNPSSGLPRYQYQVTAAEILDVFEMEPSQLYAGDLLTFDFTLHLSTGESFSSDNTGIGVKSQPHYRSPFKYIVPIDCPLDENYALGDYDMTFPDGNLCDLFFCPHIFTPEPVTLTLGVRPNQRVFSARHYGRPIQFIVDFNCGEVEVLETNMYPDEDYDLLINTTDTARPYNPDNDDIIEIVFTHNYGDYFTGLPVKSITMRLEKI